MAPQAQQARAPLSAADWDRATPLTQADWDAAEPEAPEGSAARRFVGTTLDRAGLTPSSFVGGISRVLSRGEEEFAKNPALGMGNAFGMGILKDVAAPLKRLPGGLRDILGGNVSRGAREVAASVPIVGPALEAGAERFNAGDYAGAAGEIAGTALGIVGPGKALRAVPGSGAVRAAAGRAAAPFGPTRMAARALGSTDAAARTVLDEGLLTKGIGGGRRAVADRISSETARAVEAAKAVEAAQGKNAPRFQTRPLAHSAPVQSHYRGAREAEAAQRGGGAASAPGSIRTGSTAMADVVTGVNNNQLLDGALLSEAVDAAEMTRQRGMFNTPDPQDAGARGVIAQAIREQIMRTMPDTAPALGRVGTLDAAQRTLQGATAPPGGALPLGGITTPGGVMAQMVPFLIKRGTAPIAQGYDFAARGARAAVPPAWRASFLANQNGEQ